MNRKSLRWRIPLIIFFVALALATIYPPFDPDGSGSREGKLKLGLDLQGGMHLVLRVQSELLPPEQRDDATDRAVEIIRNRIDQFGVSEPLIQRQGEDQIVLQLPGVVDRERALRLVGETAVLSFKLVALEQTLPEDLKDLAAQGLSLHRQADGRAIVLESQALLKGELLSDARAEYAGQWNEPVVALTFNSEGSKIFADITTRHTGRQLAIVLDDVVQSAPEIREPILTGNAQISGSFSLQNANDLAITLRAGALPAPIEKMEERTVGPTLGQDSIRQGVQATLYAGLIVVLFISLYYLFSGLVSTMAILLNVLFIGACLAYFKGTLTLPGIAGIILTLGMAVDTNVLILERVREEIRLGKSAAAAIASGYKKAFSAILDANVTTLLTALILFQFGTGPVRGFALTLAIGIVGSFLCGIFVTRAVFDLILSIRDLKKLPMAAILKKTTNIAFLKVSKIFMVLSLTCIIGGLSFIFMQGKDRLGVDFTGGTLQEYAFENPVQTEAIRHSLKEVGLEKAIIQKIGDKDFVIRSPQGTNEFVEGALSSSFKDNPFERLRVEEVGPVIGQELRQKALFAVLASLAMILIYLSIRFEFRYSLGAILALFHDAIICLSCVIMTGREISVPVLAALLTIVGYSVNDTIVIYDRVRENVRKRVKLPFRDLVNLSLNESLSRTLLTSVTTLLAVIALFLFGGPVINDFAFTMIIGVLVGTYSTIYVASPVVVNWQSKKGI